MEKVNNREVKCYLKDHETSVRLSVKNKMIVISKEGGKVQSLFF